MRYIEQLSELEHACVAFGQFDGVHKGHQSIIETVVKKAAEQGLTPAVISIEGEGEVLTTEQEKAYFFEKAGIKVMMTVPKETKKDVLEVEILQADGIKAVVTGEQNDRIKADNNTEIIVCKPVTEAGKPITTELIREVFDRSQFDQVEKLCGHPYIMMGEVVHGKALGRTVGMPTANIGVPDCKLKPPSGVYATLGHVIGSTYKSLTNIGTRPSVDNHDYITIEVFLLDFAQNIYGEKMTIEVHQHIRGVQKFGSLEEVQLQVKKDLEKVRNYLDRLRERKAG